MAGTVNGGRKAAATNKQRYGPNFYPQIGRKGGKISRGSAFGNDRNYAVAMGRLGGKASRRRKQQNPERDESSGFCPL